MCDYSLENYRTRPARAGEKYVTTRFPSGSVGLASPADCSTAVCVSYDTKLHIENIPEDMQQSFGIGPAEGVVFVRLENGPYHDAVRFRTGTEVPLHSLRPGITFTADVLLDAVPVGARMTIAV